MKTNRQYIEEAQNFVNENYSNAVGGAQFMNADGLYSGVDGNDNGSMQQVPFANTSQPILLNIVNTTAATVNAVIFGSYVNATASNYGNSSAIAITTVLSGISYAGILYQLQTNWLRIAELYYTSVAGSASQISQPLTYTDTDQFTGNSNVKTFVPTVDPNQNQTTVNVAKFAHVLNGNTSYTIPILANATLQLGIYPSADYKAARMGFGGNAIKDFANPSLIRPLTVAPAAAGFLGA